MTGKECKDEKCKVVLDNGNKDYLLGLNSGQIKLITRSESSRKRFFHALGKYDCELAVVEKSVFKITRDASYSRHKTI